MICREPSVRHSSKWIISCFAQLFHLILILNLNLESPNYPQKYPNYANCSWKIIPSPGNRIVIEFSDFALEHPNDYNYDDDDDYDYGDDEQDEASKCAFDVLTIEEYDSGGTLIQSKKHCETMPKKMNTTNVVLVKFESDYSNTDRGFHLEYMVEGCGKVLKKPEGEFSSQNYPKPYPINTQCLVNAILVIQGNIDSIFFHAHFS